MEKSELSFQYNAMSSIIVKVILFLFFGTFLFVGVILFLVGLTELGSEGDLLSASKFFLPGVTIFLFVMTGILYNRFAAKTKVVSAYFDIVNKRFYLETKNGDSGYIPFGEIDSFAMRKEVVSSGKSSTIYYVVYFIKKDGAWWDVVSYGSEMAALKKLNELQEKVKFDRDEEFNLLESEKPSKLFTFEEKSNSVLFKWGEQISFLYRVVSITAVISFLATFAIIGLVLGELGTIGNYVLMLFVGTFSIVILFFIIKSIFGYRDYELEVSKQKVILYGVKKDKRKILSEVATNDIRFTQYTFNMHRNDLFNGQEIFLLNQEFADKLNKYKKGEFGITEIFSLMKEIMQMKKNITKLPFPGFKSLDIILFEKRLDEELRKINPEVK